MKRALMHIPHGMLAGIPLLGLPFLILFICYEENEDRWRKDQAWHDYQGAMIGAAFIETLITLTIIWVL